MSTLLNLLVPSRANASSALKQYSAEYSINALGLLALSLLSFSYYSLPLLASQNPLSSIKSPL
jgi:hypothetical protein